MDQKQRPVMTLKKEFDAEGRPAGMGDDQEAVFHGWGADFIEFDAGPGNFSVAIVEFSDGRVEAVSPSRIRFLDSKDAREKSLAEFLADPCFG